MLFCLRERNVVIACPLIGGVRGPFRGPRRGRCLGECGGHFGAPADEHVWGSAGAISGPPQMNMSEESRHLSFAGEFDCLPEPLPTLRHSTSHVMAQAVKRLFPEVKVAIGPAIEDGFYYDFLKAEPFSPEDLARIEETMREIV